MKTLHFTNSWHASSGGIRTFYRELLKAAAQQQRQMRLVVPSETTRVEIVNDYARIYHIAAPRSLLFDARYRLLLPHTYLWQRTVREILHDEKPDLIEICDKYSLSWMAGLIRKGWLSKGYRPALIGFSCERMDDNVAAWIASNALTRKLTRAFLRQLYLPLFDYHLANSHYTANELRQAMSARHERIVTVRPMGVSLDVFSPTQRNAEARLKLLTLVGGNERTRLLLYAGRLSAEKNLPLLLDTLQALSRDPHRDFRLLVAGEGPQMNRLRQESLRRGLHRVYWLGHLNSQPALASLYANCDAFLHPNPREPFGIAPLEAMASGVPLVVPNAGGVLSYANSENAWLAEPNGAAFADAVRDVFSDDEVKWYHTTRARRTAEFYAWEKVATEFFKLYDRLHQMALLETSTGRFSLAQCSRFSAWLGGLTR
jgi:alpha-1,6-mannosyltransferase